MAKDNIFEQDLQLQGIAKILNLRLDVLASISGEPIVNKQGGLYFDSDEESLRVNVDGTNWYSTVLFNGASDDVATLPVFMANELNKVEKFINTGDADQLLYLDVDSAVSLVKKINFTHFLDPAIYTANYLDIAAGETLLPTAGAVFDYVNAITGSGGLLEDYLRLAGGEMVGDILMNTTNKIQFYNSSSYINSFAGSSLNIASATNIIFKVAASNTLLLTNSALSPYGNNNIDLGNVTNFYRNGYFGTTVFTPQVNGNGSNLTLIGKADTAKLVLDRNTVISYSNIRGDTTNTWTLGVAANYWANLYSTIVTTNSIVLSGATGLTSVASSITSGAHLTTAIPTADAVWNLLYTLETIEGSTITDMETVGMVTRFSGSNPENYYLAADDSWRSLTWVVDGTTLTLNEDLGITDFEFIAKETVAFGVKGSYTQLSYYDGNQYVLYLGDIGTSLLTDFTYFTELVGDMRTTSSIWFGGTLSTAGVVEVTDAAISAIPVLSISTAVLCTGISTDGTNIWELGGYTSVSTPTGYLTVTINSEAYRISAELPV